MCSRVKGMSQASLAYKRGDPYSMRSVFLVTSKGDWGHMLELVFLVSEFKLRIEVLLLREQQRSHLCGDEG